MHVPALNWEHEASPGTMWVSRPDFPSKSVANGWHHVKSLALAWTRESTTLPVDSWRLQFIGQEEFCESSLRNYIATERQIYDLWFTSLFTERERKITITYLRIITCRYTCCTVCLLGHLQLFPISFFAISERRLFGLNLAPKSLAARFISIKKCSQSSVIYFARGYVVLPDALS